MSARKRPDEPAPELREIAEAIDRRMAGKSGQVTLHYLRGRVETVQWGDREDARAMPVSEDA